MGKPWSEMSSRVRDYAIAVLMGDEIKTRASIFDDVPIGILHYTTDHSAARLAEDEIERRGLKHEYINHLIEIACKTTDTRLDEVFTTFADVWLLVSATPTQRCEAAWRAVGGA